VQDEGDISNAHKGSEGMKGWKRGICRGEIPEIANKIVKQN
jgi:hypothetical protein